jgi:hypothetical protein
MRPDELERRLRAHLDVLGPAPRAELLRVLLLPDFDRADRMGRVLREPQDALLRRAPDPTAKEDRTLRAVLVGMLREAEQGR